MLTRVRVIYALAGLVFLGFCLGGWLFLQPYFDDKGAPVHWTQFTVTGRTLTVEYIGDTCEDERSVEARESRNEVVVTVYVELHPLAIPFVVGCGTDGESLGVELQGPVGDRTVLDGLCLELGHPREDCVRTPSGA